VTIRLVVKTQPAAQFTVLRELRARIMAGLDAAGVGVPNPNRTLLVQPDAEPAVAKRARPAKKAAANDEG
jgi:small-conductance mechanosensitive channel